MVECPPKQLPATLRGGNDIFEIETICELPKTEFLKVTYSIQKIRDRRYQPGFKTFIGATLVKIAGMMGIKSEFDQFTKQDIVKMILSSFKELSIEEIYKAFELERYGVYEVKTDHFQLFDANYVSEILNKYRRWKIQEKKTLNLEAPKTEIEVTEEDKENIRLEFLKTVFEDLKNNGYSSDAWQFFFDLEKSGKIKLTDEEKKKLYQEEFKKYVPAEKEEIKIKSGLSAKTLLADFQKRIDSGKPLVYVQNRCRSILVSAFLKKHLTDFETFKKSIE